MKNYFKTAWEYWMYIWQLPQNFTGLLLLLYFRSEYKIEEYAGRRLYVAPKMKDAISLGNYIILSPSCAEVVEVICHEFGHTRQSRILGWLYLPVVGLSSLAHAAICRAENYYHFWTERWANKLGGVPEYNGHGKIHSDGPLAEIWERLVG